MKWFTKPQRKTIDIFFGNECASLEEHIRGNYLVSKIFDKDVVVGVRFTPSDSSADTPRQSPEGK